MKSPVSPAASFVGNDAGAWMALGLHELVRLAATVGRLERSDGRVEVEGRLAIDQQVEGPLRAIPALIPIHGEEAARD